MLLTQLEKPAQHTDYLPSLPSLVLVRFKLKKIFPFDRKSA